MAARRSVRAIALTLTLSLVGVVALDAPAGAFGKESAAWVAYYANPGDRATWAPFCAGGKGTVTASALGVPGCGPTGTTRIDLDGPVYSPGFQCAELVLRFADVKYAMAPVAANGAGLAKAYSAAYGKVLVANGTAGKAPRTGDIISFSNVATYTDIGHAGIVVAVSLDKSGNGEIRMFSQNSAGTAKIETIAMTSWRVAAYSRYAYINWAQMGGSFATITAASTPLTIPFGATTTISGRVAPVGSMTGVVLQRRVNNVWSDRNPATVAADGTFRLTVKPSQKGTYAFRMRASGGAVLSNQFYVKVI